MTINSPFERSGSRAAEKWGRAYREARAGLRLSKMVRVCGRAEVSKPRQAARERQGGEDEETTGPHAHKGRRDASFILPDGSKVGRRSGPGEDQVFVLSSGKGVTSLECQQGFRWNLKHRSGKVLSKEKTKTVRKALKKDRSVERTTDAPPKPSRRPTASEVKQQPTRQALSANSWYRPGLSSLPAQPPERRSVPLLSLSSHRRPRDAHLPLGVHGRWF